MIPLLFPIIIQNNTRKEYILSCSGGNHLFPADFPKHQSLVQHAKTPIYNQVLLGFLGLLELSKR